MSHYQGVGSCGLQLTPYLFASSSILCHATLAYVPFPFARGLILSSPIAVCRQLLLVPCLLLFFKTPVVWESFVGFLGRREPHFLVSGNLGPVVASR